MVLLTFFIVDWEYLFFGKFDTKNQNCQFKLEFST